MSTSSDDSTESTVKDLAKALIQIRRAVDYKYLVPPLGKQHIVCSCMIYVNNILYEHVVEGSVFGSCCNVSRISIETHSQSTLYLLQIITSCGL